MTQYANINAMKGREGHDPKATPGEQGRDEVRMSIANAMSFHLVSVALARRRLNDIRDFHGITSVGFERELDYVAGVLEDTYLITKELLANGSDRWGETLRDVARRQRSTLGEEEGVGP